MPRCRARNQVHDAYTDRSSRRFCTCMPHHVFHFLHHQATECFLMALLNIERCRASSPFAQVGAWKLPPVAVESTCKLAQC